MQTLALPSGCHTVSAGYEEASKPRDRAYYSIHPAVPMNMQPLILHDFMLFGGVEAGQYMK